MLFLFPSTNVDLIANLGVCPYFLAYPVCLNIRCLLCQDHEVETVSTAYLSGNNQLLRSPTATKTITTW